MADSKIYIADRGGLCCFEDHRAAYGHPARKERLVVDTRRPWNAARHPVALSPSGAKF
jgi:hypothetical protein